MNLILLNSSTVVYKAPAYRLTEKREKGKMTTYYRHFPDLGNYNWFKDDIHKTRCLLFGRGLVFCIWMSLPTCSKEGWLSVDDLEDHIIIVFRHMKAIKC